jgi:hypothetical protein
LVADRSDRSTTRRCQSADSVVAASDGPDVVDPDASLLASVEGFFVAIGNVSDISSGLPVLSAEPN